MIAQSKGLNEAKVSLGRRWSEALFLSTESEPELDPLDLAAYRLAQGHRVSSWLATQDNLLKRLADQKALLAKTYRHFLSASEKAPPLSQAAEWLLDNYHLIQQSLRQVEADLPIAYYRQLPKLGSESVDGSFHASPGRVSRKQ